MKAVSVASATIGAAKRKPIWTVFSWDRHGLLRAEVFCECVTLRPDTPQSAIVATSFFYALFEREPQAVRTLLEILRHYSLGAPPEALTIDFFMPPASEWRR